jgi:hypothetical protein
MSFEHNEPVKLSLLDKFLKRKIYSFLQKHTQSRENIYILNIYIYIYTI